MRWGITKVVFGCDRVLDLTHDEFCAVVKAKAGIVTLVVTEEKFNLVLENYEEYERELLSLGLNDLVFRRSAWPTLVSDVFTMNRRLLNSLSSARQYTDQLRHDISRTYGRRGPHLERLKSFIKQEGERTFAYRLMESIRNHAQHRGLPIRTVTYSMERAQAGPSVRVRHVVRPSLDLQALEADRKVEPDIIQRLKKAGKEGDFSLWVRQGVDALRRIHAFARSVFSDDIPRWERTLEGVLEKGHEAFGARLAGLAVVAMSDDDSIDQEEEVFPALLERRRTLEARNQDLGDRAGHYVSGRPATAKS